MLYTHNTQGKNHIHKIKCLNDILFTVNNKLLYSIWLHQKQNDHDTTLELWRFVHTFKPNFLSGKPATKSDSAVRVMTSVLGN